MAYGLVFERALGMTEDVDLSAFENAPPGVPLPLTTFVLGVMIL